MKPPKSGLVLARGLTQAEMLVDRLDDLPGLASLVDALRKDRGA